MKKKHVQACLRPRDRFWGVPAPKSDSAFDNLLGPQPSWSPSTKQQLRKLVAAPYLAPNDWTPRLDAYFASPLALTLNLTCQSLIKTGNCQIKSELLQVILISHLSKYTSRALTILITMMTPTGVVEMKKRVFPSNNSHSIRTKFFVVENAFTLVSVK